MLRWVVATKAGNGGPAQYDRLHNLQCQKSAVERAKKPTRRSSKKQNEYDAKPFSGDVAEHRPIYGAGAV